MNEEPLEVIKCKPISSKDFEIIEGEPDYLALYDTYAEHKWKFTARLKNQDDDLLVDKAFVGVCSIPKAHVCYTIAGFDHEKDIYKIVVKSAVDEITLLVDNMKDARAIHKIIMEWLYRS